jgi:zinc transporter ZupT
MVPESSGIADMTEYGSLNGALILLGIAINLCTERISIDMAQKRGKGETEDADELKRISVSGLTGNLVSTNIPATVTSELPNPQQSDASENSRGEVLSKPSRDSKDLISAHTVEIGVIVHTVIIGISVGTWNESRASLIVFTIAMAFHQFFEGIGLGTMISAASHSISTPRTALMVTAFTLSFPASICAGIGISYSSNRETNQLVSGKIPRSDCDRQLIYPLDLIMSKPRAGIFESIACGLLIYIGTISFIAGAAPPRPTARAPPPPPRRTPLPESRPHTAS